jgi:predicted MFS family arabinose efflux permease
MQAAGLALIAAQGLHGSSVTTVYFGSMLAGAGFTTHWVASAPILARLTGEDHPKRAFLFGLFEAVHTSAAVLLTLCAGPLAEALGSRLGDPTAGLAWGMAGGSAAALLAALPFAFLVEDRVARRKAYAGRPPFARVRGTLTRLVVPDLVLGFGAGLVIPFLNLYFANRFQLGPREISWCFAGGQTLMTIGFLATSVVGRRLGLVKAVVAVELASVPFFVVLALSHHLPVAVMAFLARGALMNMAAPLYKNFAMKVVPDGWREVANGACHGAWNGAWVLAALVAGRLLETSGFTPVMLLAAVLYVVTSVSFWILWRREPAGWRE